MSMSRAVRRLDRKDFWPSSINFNAALERYGVSVDECGRLWSVTDGGHRTSVHTFKIPAMKRAGKVAYRHHLDIACHECGLSLGPAFVAIDSAKLCPACFISWAPKAAPVIKYRMF